MNRRVQASAGPNALGKPMTFKTFGTKEKALAR